MPRYNNIKGVLVQCTSEEETYFDALDQDFANTAVARASAKVREKRDALIAATDWMGNSDITMTSDMTTYRAALRDVPAQAGFPDNVTWPTLGDS
jgi:hypothetical protein